MTPHRPGTLTIGVTLGARIADPTTFVQRLNSLLTALTDEEEDGTHRGDAG